MPRKILQLALAVTSLMVFAGNTFRAEQGAIHRFAKPGKDCLADRAIFH